MARARPLDAPVVDELVEQTEYPSRDFTVADPDGNHWTFATFAGPHERAELGHDCSQKHRQVNPVNTPPGPSRSTPAPWLGRPTAGRSVLLILVEVHRLDRVRHDPCFPPSERPACQARDQLHR